MGLDAMSWLYRRVQKDSPGVNTFEVGFFVPPGTGDQMAYWEVIREFSDEARAGRMVSYLNGGSSLTPTQQSEFLK
jgi:hypothetical protein